jgi:hypothetical protein
LQDLSLQIIDNLFSILDEVRMEILSTTRFLNSENEWMIACPRKAIEQSRELGIHPFKTKSEAQEFAKINQLESFRYLSI